MNSYWKQHHSDRRSSALATGRSRSQKLTLDGIIDADKRGQLYTRTGASVKILTCDRKHPHYPVVGLARLEPGGPEEVLTFTHSGRYSANGSESELDLIVRERKRVFYVGLQEQPEGAVISTGMQASKEALFEGDHPPFDAVAKVIWES